MGQARNVWWYYHYTAEAAQQTRETFCGFSVAGRQWFIALQVVSDTEYLSPGTLPRGDGVVGSGIVTLKGYTGAREVVHPDLEALDNDDADQVHFGRVVPIYPLTAGLHQKTMRALMKMVVDTYVSQMQETLPEALRRRSSSQFVRGIAAGTFPGRTCRLAPLQRSADALP